MKRNPLERKKSRNINASRTSHWGRTIYWPSCPLKRHIQDKNGSMENHLKKRIGSEKASANQNERHKRAKNGEL